jgi:hypothetical protein
MKNKVYRLILAASLPVMVQTASAQTLLTDNFTVTSGGDANNQLASRQTGTQAPSSYTDGGTGGGYQTGNGGTYVGQPGGAANSAYLLMYNGSSLYNNLAFNDSVLGGKALSVSFNIYQGIYNSQNSGDWTSFSIEANGTTPNPNTAGFGFLVEGQSGTTVNGLQVFNGSSQVTGGIPASVVSDGWTVVFSGDAAGTTSPFDGTTYVNLYNDSDPANGETGAGLVYSGQLTTALASGDQIGFHNFFPGFNESGIANLNIEATPEPATIALAGLGALSLMFFRHRKSVDQII